MAPIDWVAFSNRSDYFSRKSIGRLAGTVLSKTIFGTVIYASVCSNSHVFSHSSGHSNFKNMKKKRQFSLPLQAFITLLVWACCQHGVLTFLYQDEKKELIANSSQLSLLAMVLSVLTLLIVARIHQKNTANTGYWYLLLMTSSTLIWLVFHALDWISFFTIPFKKTIYLINYFVFMSVTTFFVSKLIEKTSEIKK